jgi:hypothetical protein
MLAEAFDEVRRQSEAARPAETRRSLLWRKVRRAAPPRRAGGRPRCCSSRTVSSAENREFYATVAELTWRRQWWRSRVGEAQQALVLEQRIEDGGEGLSPARTAGCRSTSPTGASSPSARPRSFVVRACWSITVAACGAAGRSRSTPGIMWARVSPKFGPQKSRRCRVTHALVSVAAVRGTRFYMFYDPNRSERPPSAATMVCGARGRLPVGAAASTRMGAARAPRSPLRRPPGRHRSRWTTQTRAELRRRRR